MGLLGTNGEDKEDKALTELIRHAAPAGNPPSDNEVKAVAELLRFMASQGIEFFKQPKRGGWVADEELDWYYTSDRRTGETRLVGGDRAGRPVRVADGAVGRLRPEPRRTQRRRDVADRPRQSGQRATSIWFFSAHTIR